MATLLRSSTLATLLLKCCSEELGFCLGTNCKADETITLLKSTNKKNKTVLMNCPFITAGVRKVRNLGRSGVP
jgi:hypothetical protein